MDKNTQERFLKKIQKTKTCWLWTATKNRKGYGQFGVRRGSKWKIEYAHRVAYEMFVGKIPKGLLVLHNCDNPTCVNPKHLWTGTNYDNCKDRIKKGRSADTRGEKNGRAIVNAKDVIKIRNLYKTNNHSQTEIGKMFGLKKSMVGRIVNKQAWKHIK